MQENTVHKEVMRFKTLDMDLVNTDNWLADFKIISGNEAGYFSITTDHKTNEGILIINKVEDLFLSMSKCQWATSLNKMPCLSTCSRWTTRN